MGFRQRTLLRPISGSTKAFRHNGRRAATDRHPCSKRAAHAAVYLRGVPNGRRRPRSTPVQKSRRSSIRLHLRLHAVLNAQSSRHSFFIQIQLPPLRRKGPRKLKKFSKSRGKIFKFFFVGPCLRRDGHFYFISSLLILSTSASGSRRIFHFSSREIS